MNFACEGLLACLPGCLPLEECVDNYERWNITKVCGMEIYNLDMYSCVGRERNRIYTEHCL